MTDSKTEVYGDLEVELGHRMDRGLFFAKAFIKELPPGEPHIVLVALVNTKTGIVDKRVFNITNINVPHLCIVGRHSRSDMRVDDEGLSLRHAAVLLMRDDEGTLWIRVLDLSSPSALIDPYGNKRQMLLLKGPVALGLAHSVLIVTTGEQCEKFDRDLSRVPQSQVDIGSMVEAYPASKRSSFPTEYGLDAQTSEGEKKIVTVTYHAKGKNREYQLSRNELKQGVLVGRYPRCKIGGDLGDTISESVSRTHALLWDVEDVPRVFDTSSTNGVFIGDRAITVVELSYDNKTIIDIADTDMLVWEPA